MHEIRPRLEVRTPRVDSIMLERATRILVSARAHAGAGAGTSALAVALAVAVAVAVAHPR